MNGPPRRIAVDVRSLEGEGTGVATYTRGLLAAIAHLGLRPEPVLSVGRAPRWLRAVRAGLPGGVRLAARDGALQGWDVARLAQVRFTMRGTITRLRAPGPPGMMHWPYPVPMAIAGWRNLYTVHDTIPLTAPHLTSIDPRRHRRLLDAVVAAADRIVTVSETAAADLRDVLGLPPERVVNCAQAVLPEPTDAPLPPGCEAGRYLLVCGRLEARKNLPRLLAAYAASGTTLPLLLAGPAVEGSAAILEKAAAVPGVRHLAYLDRPVLAALIAHARALLMPSLAEGFGLPVAEAMALGTPTMISRDPALLETAGGAALTVDAMDEAEIARAIGRLSDDDALCAGLSARGSTRSEEFGVSAFAQRLAALHERIA